jgi:hypothetical protein
MSRYYAQIQGAKGPASRCGTAASGMWAHVRGWDVGALITCEQDGDADVVHVYATGGSNGHRSNQLVATLRYHPATATYTVTHHDEVTR